MRILILGLIGVLLVGCAAPTADWRPLNGQDATRIERDWAACQPYRSAGEKAAQITMAVLFPGAVGGGIIEQHAIFQCMERAGYEWVGRSPRE